MNEKTADMRISLHKAIAGMVFVFLSIVISGLTAQPELVPIYSGLIIGFANFVKHFGIEQGWW